MMTTKHRQCNESLRLIGARSPGSLTPGDLGTPRPALDDEELLIIEGPKKSTLKTASSQRRPPPRRTASAAPPDYLLNCLDQPQHCHSTTGTTTRSKNCTCGTSTICTVWTIPGTIVAQQRAKQQRNPRTARRNLTVFCTVCKRNTCPCNTTAMSNPVDELNLRHDEEFEGLLELVLHVHRNVTAMGHEEARHLARSPQFHELVPGRLQVTMATPPSKPLLRQEEWHPRRGEGMPSPSPRSPSPRRQRGKIKRSDTRTPVPVVKDTILAPSADPDDLDTGGCHTVSLELLFQY